MPAIWPLARKIHRWLSYLVFLQLTLWILGGLTFAVVPFNSIVKGGAVLAEPEDPVLPESWLDNLRLSATTMPGITSFQTAASAQGSLIALKAGAEQQWLRLADGEPATQPESSQVAQYAETLYAGDGALMSVRYIEEPEYRYLGLVDELYGRVDVWQVGFDDGVGTRLYFDGPTGRFLTLRNDFWVFYDAMWRLHIMDYDDGDDFNNLFLRVLTPLALLFALSGLVLTWNAARRALRR